VAVGLKTVVRHWNRFPREVVDDLGLETAKVRLNGALSTDGAVGVSVHCREWDQMAFNFIPTNEILCYADSILC